ncbi:MAG: hypothetical protein NT145_04965 [Elusimicrobia bacterium]|nr:hypothetical protein [Elusimicrobiota bacterium]
MNAKRISTEAVSTMRRIAALIDDTSSAGGFASADFAEAMKDTTSVNSWRLHLFYV